MAARIVVVGSANMDLIAKAPKLPAPGETVLGGTFHTACGGKGANQAVAAARLGAEVWFVGRVGRDSFGEALLQSFEEAGVRTEFVRRDEEDPTGVALIFVDESGQNCIVVASGANGRVSVGDVEAASEIVTKVDALIVQFEIPMPAVERAVQLAVQNGVKVILNPAPAPREPLAEELLQAVTVLTPNEVEASGLVGEPVNDFASAVLACRKLLSKGAKAVVLTLGAMGAVMAHSEGIKLMPAFQVEAVDTTAAGDAFTAALAVSLAEGAQLEEAVRFANAAGALAVTKMGAQPSMPTRQEVERLLAGGVTDAVP